MPVEPSSRQPFASRGLEAHVAALQRDLGLRPAQAEQAVRRLAAAWLREDLAWTEALARVQQRARAWLEARFSGDLPLGLLESRQAPDRTCRLLLRAADGAIVEAVLIPSRGGRPGGRTSLCLSCQVGCARRCRFCATGARGLERQLDQAEIVAELQLARRFWRERCGEAPPISNLVFMGMGEPFDNLPAVLGAIALFLDDRAFGFAARRVTVSTVGIASRLPEFCRATRVSLAVSLGAPDDQRRTLLMPGGSHDAGLAELKSALLAALPGRRDVFFEYVLIAGLNDSEDDAEALATWLQGLPARLNLIPANPGPDPALAAPGPEAIARFRRRLQALGVRSLVRQAHGQEVGGACGQLAGLRSGPAASQAH